MALQTGLLKQNFQECYYALHGTNPKQLHLVANYTATHIYASNKGWGHLWCWIYRLADKLLGADLRQTKLTQAIVHTHSLYQKQLPQIQNHLNHYQHYLKQTASGYATKEGPIQADRSAIIAWDDATRPFLKLMQQAPHPKLRRLLQLCFKNQPADAPLFSPALMEPSKMCRQIIALEGISASPIPLSIIKNVFKQKPIHPLEIKEIKQWIAKLNQQAARLTAIHQGIGALAAFFSQPTTQQALATPFFAETLEAFLAAQGCTVFEQRDPKQMAWRRQWKPGAFITHHQGTIEVGQPVGNAAARASDTLIFNLKSHPECLALVPPNRVSLSLTELRQQHNDTLIPLARILQIMDGGRWALIERLSPLNTSTWKSQTAPLAKEDLPKANALAALLKKCVETHSTPANFSPANTMFDAQGALKALAPAIKQPFNFNALETFAFRCAAGNLAIFQYLMSTAGLGAHPTAKYYLAVATSTLRNEPLHLANLAGGYRIGDAQVVDRAASFAKELSELHAHIVASLQEQNPAQVRDSLATEVASALLANYRHSGAAHILWPSLAKSTIKELNATTTPS